MAKLFTSAFWTSAGEPATGLTPTIRIRNATTGELVIEDSMYEVGDGGYAYSFVGYNPLVAYQARFDAGPGIYCRYGYGWSEDDNSVALGDINTKADSISDTGENIFDIVNSSGVAMKNVEDGLSFIHAMQGIFALVTQHVLSAGSVEAKDYLGSKTRVKWTKEGKSLRSVTFYFD